MNLETGEQFGCRHYCSVRFSFTTKVNSQWHQRTQQGCYKEVPTAGDSSRVQKELYGEKHLVTLGAAYDPASNVTTDGQYGPAEALANQFLEWAMETVGEPSIMIVERRQLVGKVWGGLACVSESKAVFEQVIEARSRMFG